MTTRIFIGDARAEQDAGPLFAMNAFMERC